MDGFTYKSKLCCPPFKTKQFKDDKDIVKVYTNFETGGSFYGTESEMVNYVTLSEDPKGKHASFELLNKT